MGDQPFYRLGQPVRVPVSASSASVPFDLMAARPDLRDTSDLTFFFVNQNPFDLRLEGTPMDPNVPGQALPFQPVTATTGFPISARSVMGTLTSKRPMLLSVQAFSTPGVPLTTGYDYTGCVLELVYGRGV